MALVLFSVSASFFILDTFYRRVPAAGLLSVAAGGGAASLTAAQFILSPVSCICVFGLFASSE
jgi:hypothetical protein